MGYQEYWVGAWVWPAGLAHYVEHHEVMLPAEFVERAVSIAAPTFLPLVMDPRAVDLAFWLSWAGQHSSINCHGPAP
jgi:hypothetical protein